MHELTAELCSILFKLLVVSQKMHSHSEKVQAEDLKGMRKQLQGMADFLTASILMMNESKMVKL